MTEHPGEDRRKRTPLALQDDPGRRAVPMSGSVERRSRTTYILAVVFFAFIGGVPLTQVVLEWRRDQPSSIAGIVGPVDEARLRRFEQDLRESSLVHHDVLPWYQLGLVGALGKGNEKVIEGRDGWLFYREDLLNTAGPSVMDEGLGGQAAVEAIVDYRDRLAERGIALLVVPSVSKEMVDAEQFTVFAGGRTRLLNRGLEEFYAALDREGVDYERMDELFVQIREEAGDPSLPLTLPRDTHWRPDTMRRTAELLVPRIEAAATLEPRPETPLWRERAATVDGEGDLVRMLRMPHSPFEPMQIELAQVIDAETGALFESDPMAEILLMGDSLTRVFSDPELGLGEGAGFAEHLALGLNRRLDVIALAGGSASGTRDALARRAGGLDTKRLVVWQFGVRMLAMEPSRWRKVPLPESLSGPIGGGQTEVPDVEDGVLEVVAEVAGVSRIPEEFDYEFALVVFEYRVVRVVSGEWDLAEPLWVTHVAIENYEDTAVSRAETGEVHRLRQLELVDDHYDLEKVAWFDELDSGFDLYLPLSWSREE